MDTEVFAPVKSWPLRIVAYIRTSTDQQRDAHEQYRRMVQDFSVKTYGREPDAIFEDADRSGWVEDVDREGFREMMLDLRRHNADCRQVMILPSWDRFGRDFSRGGHIALKELDAMRVQQIAVTRPDIDTLNSFERRERNRLLREAEQFSDALSDLRKRQLQAYFAAGRRWGIAPLGYQINLTDLPGEPRWIPDPMTAPLVQRFLLLCRGKSISEAGQIVTDAGLIGRLRKRRDEDGSVTLTAEPVTYEQFRRMARNPEYAGYVSLGNEVGRGEHEPLISDEEFLEIQRRHPLKVRPIKSCK